MLQRNPTSYDREVWQEADRVAGRAWTFPEKLEFPHNELQLLPDEK